MIDRFAVSSLPKVVATWMMLVPLALLMGCPDLVDADEDSFSPDAEDPAQVDCNDNDPGINPAAADVCDGVDNDCDGSIDEGLDEDGDGFFEISSSLCPSGNDCDDTDAAVNPNAEEACDAIDHDCDGDPTNGLTETPYYPDADGDGYGSGDAEPNCDATPPDGFADNDEDCADNDALVNPDATEICNGVDDDCDSDIDGQFDVDLDGFTTCGADGQIDTGDEDCDDAIAAVNPDATEACNGRDDDCDGALMTDEVDVDADGYLVCTDFVDTGDGILGGDDCADADATVNPGATEVCNGVDDDCDGVAELDGDGDLYLGCTDFVDAGIGLTGGGDCEDGSITINPGATEICNGIDDNCDGTMLTDEVDVDADDYLECGTFVDAGLGLLGGEDCDDTDITVYPGAPELCDGIDNDCDLAIEDGAADDDSDTFTICDGDCNDLVFAINPGVTEEACDGLDTDCDGTTPADEGDVDGDGYLECTPYVDNGANLDGGDDCDDTSDQFSPGVSEVCDGLDNDCDTVIPTDELDGDVDGYIPCTGYVDNGAALTGGDDCDDTLADTNPAGIEVCNGLDEDCDTDIDEDFDADADTYTTCDGDCDDTNAAINPVALEVCDLVDNNCDTFIDALDLDDYEGDDIDGDGYGSDLCGGFDCDDNDAAIAPIDDDGDGFTPCSGDCDETDPYVHETATEACDGVDTDCDGFVDEADPEGVNPDWDGDTYLVDGCGVVGGTDCDDRDKHVFPEDLYTSGVQPQCKPVVYPGFTYADRNISVSDQEPEWHAGRISLPDYFVDPVSGNHYVYFRGHHEQELQVVGAVESTDGGETWGDPEGPLLGASPGEWDHRNVSQPTVAYLAGGSFTNRYVMAYHARQESGGTREIGIASAPAPLGPWTKTDPADGTTLLTAPTVPAAAGLEDDRTLHPHLYYDDSLDELHIWYSGRSTTDPGPKPLRIFHGVSTDGGMTWTRDGTVVLDAVDTGWLPTVTELTANQVSQVNVIEDPTGTTEFEIWYTGGGSGLGLGVGSGSGTDVAWDSPLTTPALESAADCRRFDGEVITGRGIRHDSATDTYHWYYGGQTDLFDGNCAGNEDLVYENGGDTASYVAYGVNNAPVPTFDTVAAPSTSLDLTGLVTDTAADQVIVTVDSDIDGFLGTATLTALVGSPAGVQTTDWSLSTTVTSGAHALTVVAVDEAGVVRTVSQSVTIP